MSNIIHPDNKNVNSGVLFKTWLPNAKLWIQTKLRIRKLKDKSIHSYPSDMPKLIFMGTPEFAVPILEKLINNGYKPVAVFCAPDKPVGRKQTLTPPPVKITAQKYNIPVYQPKDKIELASQLKTFAKGESASGGIGYQLIITAAYGLIFPKDILDTPQYGCINIHPSLLPKYRGPSPIQTAILNGDKETGVTIYKMDEQIDHGAIIAQEKILLNNVVASEAPASPDESASRGGKQSRDTAAIHGIAASPAAPRNDNLTTPELSQKLSDLGADLLLKTLPDWLAGKITPVPQDDSQATFTKIIAKEDGQIDWQKSAQEIERQIRAYTPWPGSYSQIANGQSLIVKILEAEISDTGAGKRAGEIFLTANNDTAIQTGNGALIVKKLQLEGGKPLSSSDFLRGHKDIIGKILT